MLCDQTLCRNAARRRHRERFVNLASVFSSVSMPKLRPSRRSFQESSACRMFLATNVQGGTGNRFPRSLLMIDEFQEFFHRRKTAFLNPPAVLLDRIVRQGRAFGIHVILGLTNPRRRHTHSLARLSGKWLSASPSNATRLTLTSSWTRTTPLRVSSSRPGEASTMIQRASIEGNSPFQAVWLSGRCARRLPCEDSQPG